MGFIELHNHSDLRFGLFVKLEGSWFSHPFRTNTFKIKSAADLETIRNLKKVRIFYDPERSDSEECSETETETETETQQNIVDLEGDVGIAGDTGELSESYDDSAPEDQETCSSESINKQEIPKELVIERQHNYQDFREHIRQIEGSYQKVLGQNNEFLDQVHKGRAKGLKVAEDIVGGIRQTIQNPQSAMSLIDVMGSNGVMWGLSEHALNVCMLSLLIGKHLDLSDEEMTSLGMGGLMHDVGHRLLPMKVKFLAAGMKVQPDVEILKDHPSSSCQLLVSLPGAQREVFDIILQHHERLDGSGYPKGLLKNDIHKLARIVAVADRYDELCNAPDPESSLIPHDALSRLFRHVVQKGESSKYCEFVVQALVQALGVYPPGSLVELTDGLLGVVTALSLENPMRPIVLLHAPWLCRNDGLVVNLAKDATVDIKKAIHPKDLQPSVLAYLSPRRMAMFVHTTEDQSPFSRKAKKTKQRVQTASN
ncbi:MAG: HD-GYP domain-containing protein [Nitrospirales bacterium]